MDKYNEEKVKMRKKILPKAMRD